MASETPRSYRPALDGLRAAAVGGVILYHLGYPWLPGGFLGVDLFFVLSGYLITGLLLVEHADRGSISLLRFWARRARRLLPAMLLMIGAVTAAVRWWSPANQWSARRGDLLATLFYYANWHMIGSDQSYFARYAGVSPLRHAWSLAIEEQFYLVWPLITIVLLRWGRRAVIAVPAVGALASCLVMVAVYTPDNPTRAYAGTDARVQQLLIGVLLAVLTRQFAGTRLAGWLDSVAGARLAGWTGPLAAVAVAAFMLTVNDSSGFYYRGGATLVALVVAALIWAVERAPDSPVARLLSLAPLRSVGQVSYGLYLWHWPVIQFVPGHSWMRVALTVALAATSYYLVERPIRRGRPRIVAGTPLRVAMAVPVALAGFAALAIVSTTWATGTRAQQFETMNEAPCGVGRWLCQRVPAPAGHPVIAVYGDSIAMSLDPGFVELAHRHHWGYVLAAQQGCNLTGLVSSVSPQPESRQVTCAKESAGRLRKLVDEYRPTVIFSISSMEWEGFVRADRSYVKSGSAEWAAGIHDGLAGYIRTASRAGARLALAEMPPVAPRFKYCPGATTTCAQPPTAATIATNNIYRQLQEEHPETTLIGTSDILCPARSCPMIINGIVVRYDGAHFTPTGARWFVRRLEPRLIPVVARS
ncbi:acyltransferase [Planosporangium thailandense]|uniref:Acyltransferase n=1 Tax=Planosporangium thailandense TaxID=765197 RepID=A0ABX0XUI2_9ACTN|nr:acyltransferase [Planosporangium thailandense]